RIWINCVSGKDCDEVKRQILVNHGSGVEVKSLGGQDHLSGHLHHHHHHHHHASLHQGARLEFAAAAAVAVAGLSLQGSQVSDD
ncbi:unnamed protein product, partial [Nesidiocoris tenuis]